MKKYILVVVLVSFIIPSVALASWWNPFTWNIFKRKVPPPVQTVVSTTTDKLEIKEASKEEIKQTPAVVEPKKEVKQTPRVSTQNKLQEVPKVIPVVAPVITPIVPPPPAPVAPTEAETKLYEQKLKELKEIQLKQKQIDSLTEKYNEDMSKIDQEVLDIKTKFYKDKDAIYNNSQLTQSIAEAQYISLLNKANTEIELLNIQSQQLSLNYKKEVGIIAK